MSKSSHEIRDNINFIYNVMCSLSCDSCISDLFIIILCLISILYTRYLCSRARGRRYGILYTNEYIMYILQLLYILTYFIIVWYLMERWESQILIYMEIVGSGQHIAKLLLVNDFKPMVKASK